MADGHSVTKRKKALSINVESTILMQYMPHSKAIPKLTILNYTVQKNQELPSHFKEIRFLWLV